MPLRVGSRVGHFEVTGLLGVGGMGQVYRATDTKLRRDVALKILPDQFAADPQRLNRFEREAQALAALNHPSIAAIHGIQEFDGTLALVLELIPGPTLEDRIARHPLSVAEAVRIGTAIAGAVEAAHERGIVHRDLKPANIKVQDDGSVKVLDFGLAKALSLSGEHRGALVSEEPTQAATETAPGVLVGTAAYMSPEQARGESVDERTDVWSFGCLLFEMLTGLPPFGRGRMTDVLASVLKDEPGWVALPADTPPLLRRLLRRCLEKDRRRRLRHIGDARADLEDSLGPVESGSMSGAISSAASEEQRRATATRRRSLATAALVATAAVAGLASWLIARRIEPETPTGVVKSFELTDASNNLFASRNMAVSPDGTQILYESTEGTILRSVQHSDQSRALDCGYPFFFSPDGEWIGCGGADSKVTRVSVRGGGSPTVMGHIGVEARSLGASWGRDDRIVFATTVGLHLLAASGGKAELLVAPEPEKGELSYSQPVFLPGGGTVLFTIAPRDPKASYKVAALDLESRERTTIVTGGAAPRYSPTGHLLYVAGGRLHAVAFDADTLTTRGDPQIVVDGEVMRGNFDLSDNGTLVYQRASKGTGAAEILVWVGRDGRQEPLPDAPSGWSFPVISPDGKRVTAERWPAEGRDIYVWDLERRSMSRVTDNPAEEIRPHWSADGSRIFFASNRTGPFNIYSRAADGTGSDELVFASDVWTVGAGLTPDGAQLFAHKLEPSVDIIAIDLEPPHDARYLLATSADESSPSVSPDGRWVAYASDHEGHSEIYVGPFPDMGARRWKISTSGGGLPFWSPKGDEIFFRGPTGSMMSAQVTLEPTFAPGKVTELFPNPSPEKYGVGAGTRDYDVSLDGRFLMKRRVSPAASPTEGESPRGERLVVVLDWFDELKAKVPVR